MLNARNRIIHENHPYAMMDDDTQKHLTEDEYNDVVDLLSVSDMNDDDLSNFYKITLPRIIKINSDNPLEVLHNLCMQIHDMESVKK